MTKHTIPVLGLPILVLLLGTLLNMWNSTIEPVPRIHGINADIAQQMLFQTAEACMSCHNNLVTPSGEDISFGISWRASMMANSARDPYWHAAVRREVMDHPTAQAAIENECSTCHMPMAHYQNMTNGEMTGVFANLPATQALTLQNLLAVDGVSCTSCHQITEERFGTRESFVGRFDIDISQPMGNRTIYGPYPVDAGRATIMHSSSGFQQLESKHIQKSELCATCHTLYTHSLDEQGEVIGELPEQVPYLEWRNSSFVDQQSCQSCHMPIVEEPTPISSVWGQPRTEVSRHSFRGGNFFMMGILNRYRDELGVKALPQEMDIAINRTIKHLQTKSARIFIEHAALNENELIADLTIENMAGHKLPTAYPSRRTWIRFTVHDAQDNLLFESGAIAPDGSILGNANDEDAGSYETHYVEINREDQVQIYEAILADPSGKITTGLLTATTYAKDNRILPLGFDKSNADSDISVKGAALRDDDFEGGRDRIRYRIQLNNANGPISISAELYYQPIAYRWAKNLSGYDAPETNRFTGYYNSMSEYASVVLANTTMRLE